MQAMSRFRLAFVCLFQLLFRGRLPPAAAGYLAPAEGGEPSAPPSSAPSDPSQLRTEGALHLLALFQREGRLLDFLRESLDRHDDAAIGAAVRAVHRGCKKVLDQ